MKLEVIVAEICSNSTNGLLENVHSDFTHILNEIRSEIDKIS